jgi:hypothetical protein
MGTIAVGASGSKHEVCKIMSDTVTLQHCTARLSLSLSLDTRNEATNKHEGPPAGRASIDVCSAAVLSSTACYFSNAITESPNDHYKSRFKLPCI